MPQPWNQDVGQDHAMPDFVDDRIACADVDPELFFQTFQPADRAAQERAKANRKKAVRICGGCIHRRACAQFAVETEQRYGIWGGTTPGERLVMIRSLR